MGTSIKHQVHFSPGHLLVQPDRTARVIATAKQELDNLLSGPNAWKIPAGVILHLCLPDAEFFDLHPQLMARGLVNLHNVDPQLDAFECLLAADRLYLLGNSGRGLLQAVYALEDRLVFGAALEPDWHVAGTFRIKQRHFHPRFDAWPGERADIAYLSRLGASHCVISHDWQGSLRSLHGYVTSPIFPNAVPAAEVAQNHKGLHDLIANCQDFGLEMALWLTELPCQGGPWEAPANREAWLTRFPAEVLSDSGTYQGKVLCFSHPKVQAFYRDLMARFFREFPQIETLYLFGMDSGGEGCDPSTCTRCGGLSKFEQRDRLIRFLVEEGQKCRSGLRVLTTGWHWESMPDEFLERQSRLPSLSGVYMAAQSDGWQAERQAHDLLRKTRAICKARGQLFLGYDDLHLGDDATHLWGLDLQDFPLGVAHKLARWHDLDADGVFDHWGAYNQMVPNNSIACRAFFQNPLADPETVCRPIAINQYGPAAGEQAFCAWRSIETAHRILSNCTTWAPWQWPGWYAGRGAAPTPEFLQDQSLIMEKERLVVKPANGFTYSKGTLSDCLTKVGTGWELASTHYFAAGKALEEAIELADDAPIGYGFWWSGSSQPLSRPEHLRRHKIYVDYLGLLGQEIGLHFTLHACFEQCAGDEAAYREQSVDLFAADLRACEQIIEYLARLMEQYPGTAVENHRAWQVSYQNKADQIRAWQVQSPNAPLLTTTVPPPNVPMTLLGDSN